MRFWWHIQSKLDDLIGDIKGFNRYIDYILVLGKGSLSQHIYHIIVIFDRLRTAGLKLNDPKWRFGLKEIPYLGYIITQEGIKTDPKKVKEIIDLGLPTTMTEEQELIGMVQ